MQKHNQTIIDLLKKPKLPLTEATLESSCANALPISLVEEAMDSSLAASIDPLIIISTGGTGGHIFPALALENHLLENNFRVIVTADSKFAKYKEFDNGHILIDAANFMGKSPITSIFTLAKGFFKAVWLIHKQQPALVIGFGGYASFPTMLAAIFLGKKIILHEANTVIGKVNRLLLWKASHLTTGFKKIVGIKPKYQNKIIYTGNPVRQEILNSILPKINKNKLSILIIGGSQGAKIFSRMIPEVMINLPQEIKDKLHIVQQVKEEDIGTIKARYKQENISCEVQSFFTDMNKKLAQANLVIARSGASTIAELITTQLPAILIPLPSSADNHQYHNAKEMADLKACWLVEENANAQKNLLQIIKSIDRDPDLLNKYSEALKSLQQNAAENIMRIIKSC